MRESDTTAIFRKLIDRLHDASNGTMPQKDAVMLDMLLSIHQRLDVLEEESRSSFETIKRRSLAY